MSVSTPRLRSIIRKRITRNPRQSMRKLAMDLDISATTTRRIVRSGLNLYPYRLQKMHGLTDRQSALRLERSKKLLERCSRAEHLVTVFSDEKIFTVEAQANSQNDRILALSRSEAVQNGGIVTHNSHPKYVMVWGGVWAGGKTPLLVVTPGVKVNAKYYISEILEKTLLPWSKKTFGNQKWTFQQDGAPAHTSLAARAWLEKHVPDFIPPKEWPPNSPDLNPLDFSVWGVLASKVSATSHPNVDSLTRSLKKAWDDLDVNYLRSLAIEYEKRLKACKKAKGGHIELK